jgi:hypothetical protein
MGKYLRISSYITNPSSYITLQLIPSDFVFFFISAHAAFSLDSTLYTEVKDSIFTHIQLHYYVHSAIHLSVNIAEKTGHMLIIFGSLIGLSSCPRLREGHSNWINLSLNTKCDIVSRFLSQYPSPLDKGLRKIKVRKSVLQIDIVISTFLRFFRHFLPRRRACCLQKVN